METAVEARRRGLAWGTLAMAFYEPTAEWIESLMSGETVAALREALGERAAEQAGLDALERFAEANAGRDRGELLDELRVEYTRLLIGSGPPMAVPYESVYLDRDPSGVAMVMGPSTLAVRALYRKYGLVPADSHHDLPDHVATELEFLFFLCREQEAAWERCDAIGAEGLRREEAAFLREHLAQWTPELCRLLQATASAPYGALAALLAAATS